MEKLEEYFRRAEAVAFFQAFNLPKSTLAQQHSDQNRTGFLSCQEFYNALKLVTLAQNKRELTPDIVRAALYEPASSKIHAPQINLAALPPAQPNPMAPLPPTQQPGIINSMAPRPPTQQPGIINSMAPRPATQQPGVLFHHRMSVVLVSGRSYRPSAVMFGGDLFSASQSISKPSSSSMPTQTAIIPPVSSAIVPVTSKPPTPAKIDPLGALNAFTRQPTAGLSLPRPN
ncbi:actin cytoskeleton-regulatory complex protein PAN1 [Tanacetum coccineum]